MGHERLPTKASASTARSAHKAMRSRGEELGTVIADRYTLVKLIGEGGMGSVYLAEQTQPVKRQVALKLIKSGKIGRAHV